MPELVCELIISLDGSARGERSPGYFGYFGPDFADWVRINTAAPHRILVGRRTYEMLNELPTEHRDEGWHTMASTPGWLFSRTPAAGCLRCPYVGSNVVSRVPTAQAIRNSFRAAPQSATFFGFPAAMRRW